MENYRKNISSAIQSLNLGQSLDVIKFYFLNDNPTLPKLQTPDIVYHPGRVKVNHPGRAKVSHLRRAKVNH